MFYFPFPGNSIYWKIICFGAGFLFFATSIFAGNDNYPAGARSAGLANASVTLTDEWSSFNNQAGLAYLKLPTIGAYFENKFLVKEYALQAACFAFPTQPGTISASFRYFGFSLYHESKIGLAFGRKFSKRLAAGVQVDYLQTYIAEGYENYNTLAGEIGLLAEPVDHLFVGFHVFNPSRIKNDARLGNVIPTVLKLGLGYHYGEKAIFLFETEKAINQDPVYKGGLEVLALDKLYFRFGYTSLNDQVSVGLGYQYHGVKLDLAFSQHPVLGYTPHASLGYEF